MNNFIFYSPTEFVFGRDTEAQTGVLVQKYGARKIMIVYGGGSVIRSGLLARVEKSFPVISVLMGDIMQSVENALLIGKISFVMMLLRGQACRWGTE